MVFSLITMLYATDTYGTYSMPGSWSDGDTFAGATYDGNGSGDDSYGVSVPANYSSDSELRGFPAWNVCSGGGGALTVLGARRLTGTRRTAGSTTPTGMLPSPSHNCNSLGNLFLSPTVQLPRTPAAYSPDIAPNMLSSCLTTLLAKGQP